MVAGNVPAPKSNDQKCEDRVAKAIARALGCMTSCTTKLADGKLAHDRLVVRFRWMLHARFGDRLRWSQHRYNIYDRWETQVDDHILADAFFYLQRPNGTYPSFFVEVEKTNEAKYDLNVNESE